MLQDHTLAQLLHVPQDETEQALAARYAPRIRFDAYEPFLPLAAGYTVFESDGTSPSFSQGKSIELSPPGEPPASLAIEYAIWWDWDIGHLYELEHVWVSVDAAGSVVRGEASWHSIQPWHPRSSGKSASAAATVSVIVPRTPFPGRGESRAGCQKVYRLRRMYPCLP